MNTFSNYVITDFEAVIGEVYYYSEEDFYAVQGLIEKINSIIEEIDLDKRKYIESGLLSKDDIDTISHKVSDYNFNYNIQKLIKSKMIELNKEERQKVIDNFKVEDLIVLFKFIDSLKDTQWILSDELQEVGLIFKRTK